MKDLTQLTDKEAIEAHFLVKYKALLKGRTGKPYLSLALSNKTGQVDARIWENAEKQSELFEEGQIVYVKGRVQLYQEKFQIVVHDFEIHGQEQFNREDFLSSSLRDPSDMFAELIIIVNTVEKTQLKRLLQSILEDDDIKAQLLLAPAAKSIHHAWIGGLLEHILSLCQLSNSISEQYSFLDRDLLIAGCVLHDIGKIWEISVQEGFQYTDRGRLLGHIEIACELIDKKCGEILEFDSELKDVCKHIVLSHHGRLEFGSPKRPKILEAFVFSMLDEFDSKIATVHEYISNQGDKAKWSPYNPLFDRYFYLKSFLEDKN